MRSVPGFVCTGARRSSGVPSAGAVGAAPGAAVSAWRGVVRGWSAVPGAGSPTFSEMGWVVFVT